VNELANQQHSNGQLRELALFAGAGGGILGGVLLGWRTVCAVEINAYAASVLCARQNDGILPPFPIWDDIRTFDGRPWRGIVDVVSGGFPCQDISCAGKGKGITGERSGLWKEMARIIREVRPQFAFIENSPMLIIRGLETVLCDLAKMGYDAKWGVIGNDSLGCNHRRWRLWIHAYTNDRMHFNSKYGKSMGFHRRKFCTKNVNKMRHVKAGYDKTTEPNIPRMADDDTFIVDRGKAIGNMQCPAVAALAWETLSNIE
jgi:DNA (cytosine-5)-methyltransferase 1